MTNDSSLSPDLRFQLIKKIERHKVIGLGGYKLLEHESKYLEFHRLSGVILFERNIESFSQVRDLIGAVSEKLTRDDMPPLVMVDHEGDFVSELRGLIGIPPSAMAVAAIRDPDLAREVACETGRAMLKLGVNVVLAPVADCYLTPECPVTGLRTFGKDPDRVAEFVGQTLRGFRESGIIACVKHFPGHGAAPEDSHETLPRIERTLEELRRADLVPFVRAVEDGVDMVMMAHVAYALEDGEEARTPASFDARLIRGLLREELGFNGVVITDALEMEGARVHSRETYGGLTGGFERSILAGSDLLLYASPVPERLLLKEDAEPVVAVEVMQTIIDTLHKVVDPSRIERKLEEAAKTHEGLRNLLGILNGSEKRVDHLRRRAADSARPALPRPEGNVIRLDDYAAPPAIYKAVAERSLVLLRDPDSFVPVDAGGGWTLLPIAPRHGASLKAQDLAGFLEALCRRFPRWRPTGRVTGFQRDGVDRLQPIFEAPEHTTILDAQRATGSSSLPRLPADAAILPVFSARGMPGETFLGDLADFIEQRHVPFVLVTGAPIIEWIPEHVGCLVTFGAGAQVAAAVADVLAGSRRAVGSLAGLV